MDDDEDTCKQGPSADNATSRLSRLATTMMIGDVHARCFDQQQQRPQRVQASICPQLGYDDADAGLIFMGPPVSSGDDERVTSMCGISPRAARSITVLQEKGWRSATVQGAMIAAASPFGAVVETGRVVSEPLRLVSLADGKVQLHATSSESMDGP